MNITECSKQLKILAKAHAHYTMSLEDYLRDRKVLLDALDLNINGIAIKSIAPEQEGGLALEAILAAHESDALEGDTQEADKQQDKTQPYFVGKIDQCMSFIKGSNN